MKYRGMAEREGGREGERQRRLEQQNERARGRGRSERGRERESERGGEGEGGRDDREKASLCGIVEMLTTRTKFERLAISTFERLRRQFQPDSARCVLNTLLRSNATHRVASENRKKLLLLNQCAQVV